MKPTSNALRIVVPALKITGGIKEIVKLALDARAAGADVRIVAMWRADNEVSCAPIPIDYVSQSLITKRRVLAEMPQVTVRLLGLVRDGRAAWLLSHYSTYVAAPFASAERLWFFVQDLEWTFVRPAFRPPLRRFILACLRRGRVLAANDYLASALMSYEVPVRQTLPIWADPAFAGPIDGVRDIDVVMVLRRGSHKRLDLVLEVLAICRTRYPHLRLAIITPNDEFVTELSREALTTMLVRPSVDDMRNIYRRTHLFLLLSDHEGFGLPPLEAMGSGCVPMCRDAGGVRAYMQGSLRDNILPAKLDTAAIMNRVVDKLADQCGLDNQRIEARAIFDRGVAAMGDRVERLAESGIV